jgi:hypothetical protein
MRGAAHGFLVEQLSACMYPCWKGGPKSIARDNHNHNARIFEVSSAPSNNQEYIAKQEVHSFFNLFITL